MIPRRQVSVKDNTQVFFSVQRRTGVLIVFGLRFLSNNLQCHDCMQLIF